MKSQLKSIVAMGLLFTAIFGIGEVVHGQQITVNAYEDTFPNIAGGFVVWQGRVGGDWEVFLYDISAGGPPVQLTQNDYDDILPQTDGNYVTWLGYNNSGGEIFFHNIATAVTTEITSDNNEDFPPHIANGLVAWASHVVGDSVAPGEIFLYRIATQQVEQLTSNAFDDSSPRIDDQRIVWVRADGPNTTLFVYDLPSGPVQEAPQGFVFEGSPQTDGDLTVFTRHDDQGREIFVHNTALNTYKQITSNNLEDRYPCISGDNVAWVGGEGKASELFLTSYSAVPVPAVMIQQVYTTGINTQTGQPDPTPKTNFAPGEPIQFHVIYDVAGDLNREYKVKAVFKVFENVYPNIGKTALRYPGTGYHMVKSGYEGSDIRIPGSIPVGATKTCTVKLKLKLDGDILDVVKGTCQITIQQP